MTPSVCVDCGGQKHPSSGRRCRPCYRLLEARRKQERDLQRAQAMQARLARKKVDGRTRQGRALNGWGNLLPPDIGPKVPYPAKRKGYCVECHVIRLSVANTGGVCDGCLEWQTQRLRYTLKP